MPEDWLKSACIALTGDESLALNARTRPLHNSAKDILQAKPWLPSPVLSHVHYRCCGTTLVV